MAVNTLNGNQIFPEEGGLLVNAESIAPPEPEGNGIDTADKAEALEAEQLQPEGA